MFGARINILYKKNALSNQDNFFVIFCIFFYIYDGKRRKQLLQRQKMVLTSKRHADHPLAGRNTQHLGLEQLLCCTTFSIIKLNVFTIQGTNNVFKKAMFYALQPMPFLCLCGHTFCLAGRKRPIKTWWAQKMHSKKLGGPSLIL